MIRKIEKFQQIHEAKKYVQKIFCYLILTFNNISLLIIINLPKFQYFTIKIVLNDNYISMPIIKQ